MQRREVERSAWIDSLRGAALVVILVNHFTHLIGPHLLTWLTWTRWGFSDASALFFFLSGWVVNRASLRRLEQGGFANLQKFMIRRGIRLAAWHWLTTLAILFLPAMHNFVRQLAGLEIGEVPLVAVLDVFLFRSFADHFTYLPFYLALILVTPFVVVVAHLRSRRVATVTLVAWVLLQVETRLFGLPELGFARFAVELCGLAPLYIAGVIVSGHFEKMRAALHTTTAKVIAFSVVVASFLYFVGLNSGLIETELDLGFEKSVRGPLRNLHFAALAVLFHQVAGGRFTGSSTLLKMLAVLGRNSLICYCVLHLGMHACWYVWLYAVPHINGIILESLLVGFILSATFMLCRFLEGLGLAKQLR